MKRLYRSLLVLGIFILTVLGLNVSNQGINSLMIQNRPPVLALQLNTDRIALTALGKSYTVEGQSTRPYLDSLGPIRDKYRHSARKYLGVGTDKASLLWAELKRQIIWLSAKT